MSVEHQRAAHALRELAPDREAEPEARLAARLAAALEALEDQRALLLARRPGPGRLTLSVGSGWARTTDPDVAAARCHTQRVVEQDPQDPGDAARDRRAPTQGCRRPRRIASTPRLELASSNSASTARPSSPSSIGSERRLTSASMRLRSSRSAASRPSRRDWARARSSSSPASSRSQTLALQVVRQQLEHAVERGQRRAQLVRGRRHERAPRLLLLAQPALHDRERARQVAHLVARPIHREVARPLPPIASCSAACRNRCRRLTSVPASGIASSSVSRIADQRRDLERAAHRLNRAGDLIDRLAHGKHRVRVRAVERQRDRGTHDLAVAGGAEACSFALSSW